MSVEGDDVYRSVLVDEEARSEVIEVDQYGTLQT